MKKQALYVDDLRPLPKSTDEIQWTLARNFHEAICILDRMEDSLDIVSLDHDIASFYGNKEMTGWDVLQYMIMQKLQSGLYENVTVFVHSANPVGITKMQADIDRYFS